VHKKITIAISGQPVSGKTTYARFIAEKYGLRHISSGKLFRMYAKEKGLSLLELHKLAEIDSSIDATIDAKALQEAKKGNVVIEGHLAAWIVKDYADIRIFFKAPLEERGKRLSKRDNISIEEAIKEIITREESNKKRAKKYYGINLDDWSIFDLIIDTSKLNIPNIKNLLSFYIDLYLQEHKL